MRFHGPARRGVDSSYGSIYESLIQVWGTSSQPAQMAETSGVKMAEDVRAEIVASVLEVVVNEGDQIGKGDIVVLLESMKMEIPVLAEVDGTVSKVSVAVGDVIQAGDLIAVIS